MPLFYSVVARGTVILANHASCPGNFVDVMEKLLSKINIKENSKRTYALSRYMCHYICEDGLICLCISAYDLERSYAFEFLNRIRTLFKMTFGSRSLTAAMNKDFSRVLAVEMKALSADEYRIARMQNQVEDLNSIAFQRIDSVLEGEKVELLIDRSKTRETDAVSSTSTLEMTEFANVQMLRRETSSVTKRISAAAYPDRKKARKMVAVGDVDVSDGLGDAVTVSLLPSLPEEIWVKIIEMLPKAQWPSLESVNKELQSAVHYVWLRTKKFNLDGDFVLNREAVANGRANVLVSVLRKLLLRSPNTTEITGFSSVGSITKQQRQRKVLDVLAAFKHLERVSFGNSGLKMAEIRRFLQTTDSRNTLKELNVSGIYNTDPETVDGDVEEPNLLKIFYTNSDTNGSLNICGVSQLTSLRMDGTQIEPDGLAKLITDANNLTELGFNTRIFRRVPPASYEKRVSDFRQLYRVIIETVGKNLAFLKITGGDNRVTNELDTLLKFCGQHGQLTSLILSFHRHGLYGRTIHVVSEHLKGLASLELTHLIGTPPPLLDIVRRMASLRSIKLDINTPIVKYRSEFLDAISTNLTQLRSLSLRLKEGPAPNLIKLRRLKYLKELVLIGTTLTNSTLCGWSRGFGSNVESLILEEEPCAKAGHYEIGLEELLRSAKKLRRLQLNFPNLTDSFLERIASICPLLQEFAVFHRSPFCSNTIKTSFSAAGIQHLVDRCQYLKYLSVIGANQEFWPLVRAGKYRKVVCGEKPLDFGENHVY